MIIREAFDAWCRTERDNISKDDVCALAESWNNYTDYLTKKGELSGLQYRFCPAYDDSIPDDLGEELKMILDGLQISVEPGFIPFSQSRNKDSDTLSLNWSVTLKIGKREILTTDYTAGVAHCPGYYKSPHAGFHGSSSIYKRIVTRAECERGQPVKRVLSNDDCIFGYGYIDPDPVDVVYSLLMDSSVLDESSFEEWADSLGYDTDSRNAESIYRDCLEIALKLRAGLGDTLMAELRDAFGEY